MIYEMNIFSSKKMIFIELYINMRDNKMSEKGRIYKYFDEEAHDRILDLLKGDWGKETFTQMKSYAENGHAEAQYYLGIMYDDGKGVEQDSAQAAQWYRRAAENGMAAAQCNLAGMYETGDGVPTDYIQAKKWYRLAAEQGDKEAQRRLYELRS